MPRPGLSGISFLFALAFSALFGRLQGQDIFFELTVEPNPPVYAYEWEQNPHLVVLYVTNLSSGQRPVIVKGRLFDGSGSMVGETDDFQMPLTNLEPEFNVLYPIEFVPSSALIFYGGFEEVNNTDQPDPGRSVPALYRTPGSGNVPANHAGAMRYFLYTRI